MPRIRNHREIRPQATTHKLLAALFALAPTLCRYTQSPQAFKGAKLDGPTLHAVFYFTLREETANALKDLESAEPSVRLLAEYFRLVGVVLGLLAGVLSRRRRILVYLPFVKLACLFWLGQRSVQF